MEVGLNKIFVLNAGVVDAAEMKVKGRRADSREVTDVPDAHPRDTFGNHLVDYVPNAAVVSAISTMLMTVIILQRG